MNARLEELLALLRQETGFHERLLDLLQEEAEGFGKLSGSEMLKLQTQKLQQTRLIAKLENRRILLIEEMEGDFDEDAANLTLRSIIRQVPVEWSTPLQACFDRLKELINEIRIAAETNGEQSESRLKSVESSLQFISQMQGAQQLYSESGQLQTSASKISRASI